VWTVGTFINLVLVNIFTSEAPYNLVAQMIGTDGALIGLFIRTFRKGGGLSAFHFL
jgi:hypothetical protein